MTDDLNKSIDAHVKAVGIHIDSGDHLNAVAEIDSLLSLCKRHNIRLKPGMETWALATKKRIYNRKKNDNNM